MTNSPMPPLSSAKKNSERVSANYYKQAIWYPLVGLVVILFVSESFISESEFLRQLIQEAGNWIPAINNLSAVSEFPLLTGLYLTVMWALLPFAVWWWIWKLMRSRKKAITPPPIRLLLSGLLLIPLALVLVMSVVYWFPYHPDERQLSLHAGRSGVFLAVITNFRLGLGFGLGAFFLRYRFFFNGLVAIYLALRNQALTFFGYFNLIFGRGRK